jgi:hypothetical protein
VISRGQKLTQCQLYIIKLINEGKASDYPLVETIANELYSQEATEDMRKIQQIMSKYIWQSWFALFEILDTPVEAPVQAIELAQSGNTSSWGTVK